MLYGKTIVVGVTGGIAAYKACEVVSLLKKAGAEVFVVMTKAAREFVAPKSFETLSGNAVAGEMFAPIERYEVEHISLAKRADLFAVAPATANTIGKIANGLADDMLSAAIMASAAPKLIAPAMNTGMYQNCFLEGNLQKLRAAGYHIVEPESGRLACGDEGKGRLAAPEAIVNAIQKILGDKEDYAGKRILITAGGTAEPIDAVRDITNRSSGKTGVAIAKAAARRGAAVTLVMGTHTAEIPPYLNAVEVKTAGEMYEAVFKYLPDSDIVIKAAAVGDYRVMSQPSKKIKADAPVLTLQKNKDIAQEVGKVKGKKKLVVFCAEAEDLEARAEQKRKDKNADLVVANNIAEAGCGFGNDTNRVYLRDKKGGVSWTNLVSKDTMADIVLDKILLL